MNRMNPDPNEDLKVALIHASIFWRDKDKNVSKLLALNEEAARKGSKIIVNTELATTGYAFESRRDIAPLVESIPGPTTEAFGKIAMKYGCYICMGLPERDPKTGIFYNSAALLGPAGSVVAKHRKLSPAFRENLWAAKGNLPIPVVRTEFGPLSFVICADSYFYRPARIAALQGARLMMVPANWPPEHHNPEKFWRARALENGMYILACNRTGKDKVMDCNHAQSCIVGPQGKAMAQISSPEDTIIYGTLPLSDIRTQNALSARHPRCYGNITLDPYSHISIEFLLGLPQSADFTAATLQFSSKPLEVEANVKRALQLIDDAEAKAARDGQAIDLVVLPELLTSGPIFALEEAMTCSEGIPGEICDAFAKKAREKDLFIVFGMAEHDVDEMNRMAFYNSSLLVGPKGVMGRYRKIHLSPSDRSWALPGNCGFSTVDLPFARIGMLIGHDLMFPEASDSLAKLGADMICVPALWDNASSKFIWEARLSEQTHLAIANQWGNCGRHHAMGESLLCNYSRFPERITLLSSPSEGDAVNILKFQTKDSREKRFMENIDYSVLLDLTD